MANIPFSARPLRQLRWKDKCSSAGMHAVEMPAGAVANSLPEDFDRAVAYFSSPENCIGFVAWRRWPKGEVLCPACGAPGARFLAARGVWECRRQHPRRQFSVRAGTLLGESHLPLEHWLVAIWLLANSETKVSSYDLARRLGITQKSAWFMLRRIRLAFQIGKTRLLAQTGLRAVCKGL